MIKITKKQFLCIKQNNKNLKNDHMPLIKRKIKILTITMIMKTQMMKTFQLSKFKRKRMNN